MIDWTMFSSLVGLGAALVSIVALIYETRKSRISLQTGALLTLTDKMNSKDIRDLRRQAAKKALTGDPNNFELGEVLDFFGTIAYLVQSGAIDNQLAYKEFSWWMIRYWLCSEDYVREGRTIDPLGWATLEEVVKQLMAWERRDGYPPDAYSKRNLKLFLEEESLSRLSTTD